MQAEQPIAIIIESEYHRTPELERALQDVVQHAAEPITLEVRKQDAAFRLEPTILVALIGGGFKVLIELTKGILQLANRSDASNGVIRIEDSEGNLLEVPANTPVERVQDLLEAVRGRTVSQIMLIQG